MKKAACLMKAAAVLSLTIGSKGAADVTIQVTNTSTDTTIKSLAILQTSWQTIPYTSTQSTYVTTLCTKTYSGGCPVGVYVSWGPIPIPKLVGCDGDNVTTPGSFTLTITGKQTTIECVVAKSDSEMSTKKVNLKN